MSTDIKGIAASLVYKDILIVVTNDGEIYKYVRDWNGYMIWVYVGEASHEQN